MAAMEAGSLVSFRGNQWLHGGTVVTAGVRYIIAAFLYLDDDHGEMTSEERQGVQTTTNGFDNSTSPLPKRPRTSEAEQSFSFNFF